MGESGTADELVSIVVANKVVDVDDPFPVEIIGGSGTPQAVTIADGSDVAEGSTTDTTASNTVIGRLKKLVALLPTALGGHGGLVVEGVASGTAVPASVADGSDVAEGATADAAVITNATGTVSGKLRGLVAILADVWNSTLHFLGVTLVPATSGGLSIYRNLDVQTTGVRIKSGAGQIYWLFASNQAATVRFIKLYDSNSNPPTSAETPVLTIAIPAASGGTVPIPQGLAFASGIGVRASSAVADADGTAPTANDVIVNLGYK